MFLEETGSGELRQGDIIRAVYYPRLSCRELQLFGKVVSIQLPDGERLSSEAVPATQKGETPAPIRLTEDGSIPLLAAPVVLKGEEHRFYSAQIPVRCSYCVVLTQCCELVPRTSSKGRVVYPPVTLAPLDNIPYSIRSNAEQLKLLEQNPPADFYSAYFIRDQARLGGDYIANFSFAFTLANSDFSFLLEQKFLQMVDVERVRFKMKLARFYGRPTEEERQAGLWSDE